MPDKLTDSEIVKALECCADYKNTKCKGCPLEESCVDNNICGLALDLINHLQEQNEHYSHNVKEMTNSIRNYQKALEQAKAENGRLKREIEDLESVQEISPEAKYLVDTKADKVISLLTELNKSQEQIKAEAVKEFWNKLKSHSRKMQSSDFSGEFWDKAILVEDIDNLLKEMVGDNNES